MSTIWTLAKIWNESLENRAEHPVAPRDRIWASELGRSDVDTYLKMMGEKPTNPPNSRALRKFEAGNVWEWIIKLILIRSGIYRDSQTWLGTRLDGCVEVSGKLDFIAGGKLDIGAARAAVESMMLPEVFTRAVEAILANFAQQYPDGLEEKILEVKSVSSYAFDKVEETKKPVMGHDLQTYHYVRNKQMDGAIVYICRDDARMYQIEIPKDDAGLEGRYCEKIQRLSKAYFTKTQPDPEPPVFFDENELRFTKNFNCEYSGYLTKLYGFEHQQAFSEHYGPIVERWNRVLGRVKDGKDMTANNTEALEEMKKAGFDPDKIIPLITVQNG